MTLSKASLGEAQKVGGYRFNDLQQEAMAQIFYAAGFVERLLPGTCENCHGKGQTHDDPDCYACTCQVCHGTGQLWDEGLVEVMAEAIYDLDPDPNYPWAQLDPKIQESYRKQARAVLAALTAEVGK